MDAIFDKSTRTGSDLRRRHHGGGPQGVYKLQAHPKFPEAASGTEDRVFNGVPAHLRGRGHVDGTITKDEFMNYYSGVSASVDNDAYFALIMKNRLRCSCFLHRAEI
uniref:EF-hand domain-containing protein n=1 Tax=Macrostomum lignano TaxID=282301 RepID=A0A1I8F6X9_9PLAT